MQHGAITGYIDVAQLALYAFWIFFAGLVVYLRREDKREGYPLESDRSNRIRVQGFPPIPRPKTFLLPHGGIQVAPRIGEPALPINARAVGGWLGAPLHPLGDPMLAGVGPGAYALRADVPDLTVEGFPRIVPLRVAAEFSVAALGPDPRGMAVFGADRRIAGRIHDLWVDRSDMATRYFELETAVPDGVRQVLLPATFARVDSRRGRVYVKAILASQFATAPALQDPDRITSREEDRITAYFASGHLYATPSRLGPVL